MSFFENVVKKFNQTLIAVRATPKLKIPKTPTDVALDAVAKVGEHVVDVGKDVVDGGKAVVETTGEFVSDAEYFMKTGDFNRAVQKLQEEEGDAEEKMLVARIAFDAALATYVRTALKLRSLSIAHEQMQTTTHGNDGTLGSPGRMFFDVDPDLYGTTTARFLDSIGLEVIGNVNRTMQKLVPFRHPMSLVMSQPRLAAARKLLRENISAYRQATVEISRATADTIEQNEVITVEVERLEAAFLNAGLDLETGASRDLADQVEETAKLELARELLKAGLSVEDVANATELSRVELEALS